MSQTKIGSGFIKAGAISANTILSTGVITADLIATGAVGPTELATGAVSANTKIGTGVVGAREIRLGNLAAANAVFTHNSHTYARAQSGRVESITVGAANVQLNFANANIFSLTLGINTHLNLPSNMTVGQGGSIVVGWKHYSNSGRNWISYFKLCWCMGVSRRNCSNFNNNSKRSR